MPDQPHESQWHVPRILFWIYGIDLVLLQVYLWAGFLVQTVRLAAPTSDLIQYSFAIVNGIGMVVWSFARRRHILLTAFWLIFTFSQLVVNFSYLYWSHGSGSNFTMPLSHLDAIYFTVGTLSTSGTGNVAAMGETTRGLQTLQNVFDLGLVLLAVSLFVSRLAETFGGRRATPGA